MSCKSISLALWAAAATTVLVWLNRHPREPLALAADSVAPAANELIFPTPYNSEPDKTGPMPAAEAASKMKLPPGFKATVFASEPDVQNPIAMSWDSGGRLWIAENYTYAENPKKMEYTLRDRILIFEDAKGDGHFSSRKVFTDQLQALTSVEVGRGGVWAMCPPKLLFIPMRAGMDTPSGPPQVMLDGFTLPAQNHHNFANGLRFGPDGWLYGRCGHSAPGEIGVPGTPDASRIPLRGTIWRYHPQRKIFEALAAGTTNPWGHDWDEHGELFFVNTVNGHLWHQITGAHYMVTGGNAHTYELIDQHADHWHFDNTQNWTKSRNGGGDAFGGGHAHVGAMIYLADNWPAEYHGHLFTFNMHGYRANQEVLERTGSGYVGHHGTDFLFTSDKWFRGIDLAYGPDGGVFALDWSDTGECHESTGVHRTSGRIFKITYGDAPKTWSGDLTKLDLATLVKLHTHTSEWFVRQARRELADRVFSGADLQPAAKALHELYSSDQDVVHKLRAVWSLFAIGAVDDAFLHELLASDNEHIRAWAVRLLTDRWPLDTAESLRPTGREEANVSALLPQLVALAKSDPSALVRLVLASTLQRLPVNERVALAEPLVTHAEDAHDHNLPLLIWYGLIPVADTAPESLARLAAYCGLPQTRKLIARRLAEDLAAKPAAVTELISLVAASPSEALRIDVVAGFSEAVTGWRATNKPARWDDLAKSLAETTDVPTRDRLRDFSVLFGDPNALAELEQTALDQNATPSTRKASLQKLIDHKAAHLRAVCEALLKVRGVNGVAARGLAGFDDPALGALLVNAFPGFNATDRPQLIAALVARPASAALLLDAVESGHIPRTEVTASLARQIRAFHDDSLSKRLATVWGNLRESSDDKKKQIADLKSQLNTTVLKKADRKHGHALFIGTCAVCHKLYGEGASIGPDLTGSGRDNLDYLLENIVDPSAVVPAEYRMMTARLKDGQIVSGIVAARTERTISLKTVTETTTLEVADVANLQQSAESMMPEGLLEAMNATDVRDLIGFLMYKGVK